MSFMHSIPNYILNQCDVDDLPYLGRVIGEERDLYLVLVHSTQYNVKKNLNNELRVGDWVILDQDMSKVVGLIPHVNQVSRYKNGSVQVIANNVDQLWVVTSVNSDLNYNRLERYMKMAMASEVLPVIILSKIDLVEQSQLEEVVLALEDRFPDAEVVPLSVVDDLNCEVIEGLLNPKETVILMGSSGVGKSTLINYICNSNQIKTQGIRRDGKGRHTTTNRRMYLMDNGCFIVDNPGIRGVGVLSEEPFDFNCKFSNCSHSGEPGCDVERKIEQGELTVEAFENMQKLQRESEYLRSRGDIKVYQIRQKKWKAISKMARRK